jgi:hypothetical protein
MPLSFVGVELLAMPAFSSSGVIVEVEVDREKVLARGARCVSLSSSRSHISIMVWEVNGKVQYPQPACVLVFQRSLSPVRLKGVQRALKREGEAVLTLGQFPRHIDVVVE